VNKYGGGVIGRFNHQMLDLKKLGWLVSSCASPCWVDPLDTLTPHDSSQCFSAPLSAVNCIFHMGGRRTTSKVWLRAELVRPQAELLWRAKQVAFKSRRRKKHTKKCLCVFLCFTLFLCLSRPARAKNSKLINDLQIFARFYCKKFLVLL